MKKGNFTGIMVMLILLFAAVLLDGSGILVKQIEIEEKAKQDEKNISKYIISGTILDEITEEPISDAEIKLFNGNDSYFYTYSTKEGFFFFRDIEIGIYDIEISHKDYKTFRRSNLIVSVGCEIDFKLEISKQMYYSGIVPEIDKKPIIKSRVKKIYEIKTDYNDFWLFMEFFMKNRTCITSDNKGNIYYLNPFEKCIVRIDKITCTKKKIKLEGIGKNELVNKIYTLYVDNNNIFLKCMSTAGEFYVYNNRGKLLEHKKNVDIYLLKREESLIVGYTKNKQKLDKAYKIDIIENIVEATKPIKNVSNVVGEIVRNEYLYSIKEENNNFYLVKKSLNAENTNRIVQIEPAEKINKLGYKFSKSPYLFTSDVKGNLYVILDFTLSKELKFRKAKEYYPEIYEIRKYESTDKYVTQIRDKRSDGLFISNNGELYRFGFEKDKKGKYNVILNKVILKNED